MSVPWIRIAKVAAKWIGGLTGLGVAVGAGGIAASGLILPAVDIAAIGTSTSEAIFEALPEDLELTPLAQSSYIYAADGTLLATFYFQDRTEVPLDQISLPMQHAVVALEDKRYYQHVGVDWEAMGRALAHNLVGVKIQGASTITQQYIKNLLINKALSENNPTEAVAAQELSYQRKIREAKLAISLEKRMTKDQILEGYLNIAQFGPNRLRLDTVVVIGCNAVGVDVPNVRRLEVRVFQGKPNGGSNRPARRSGFMERRFVRCGKATDRGVDFRSPCLGELPTFQHQGPGSFTENSTVAVCVEGTRYRSRIIATGCEKIRLRTGLKVLVHTVAATTGDHHIGVAALDDPHGFLYRCQTGTTAERQRVARSVSVEGNRNMTGRHIRQEFEHPKGKNFVHCGIAPLREVETSVFGSHSVSVEQHIDLGADQVGSKDDAQPFSGHVSRIAFGNDTGVG